MFRTVVVATLAAAALALSGCGEADAPESTPTPAAPAAPAAPAPAEPAPAEPAPVESAPTESAPVETYPEPGPDAAVNNRGWEPEQHEQFVDEMRDHLREEGIHPNYGHSDGSVDGPGALDPDVYGDGPTSGESQRAWLEEQGLMP